MLPYCVHNGKNHLIATIFPDAFRDSAISGISIGENVASIGDNAFRDCTSLSGALTLPKSLGEIGNKAFYNCSAMTGDLTIFGGVHTIGMMAFRNCTGVTGLTIGSGVTSIGDFALSGLTGLKTVLFLPTSFGAVDMMGDCLSFCNVEFDPVMAVSKAGNEFPADYMNPYTVFNIDCSLVTGSASMEGSGTVVGGGIFKTGETVTFEVIPAPGYKFVQWADGKTANLRGFTLSARGDLVAEMAVKECSLVYNTPNGANGANPTNGTRPWMVPLRTPNPTQATSS